MANVELEFGVDTDKATASIKALDKQFRDLISTFFAPPTDRIAAVEQAEKLVIEAERAGESKAKIAELRKELAKARESLDDFLVKQAEPYVAIARAADFSSDAFESLDKDMKRVLVQYAQLQNATLERSTNSVRI